MLGAVLASTDAAAVAGQAKWMPRRTLTTLRAESLINDGAALVLFAVAVSAATADAARIDEIVLRELQAAMDLEEIRLLGPVPTD